MTVSNLVFFIISSILILATIFIPICVVFHDYCLAVKKDKVCKWYDYMGDGVLLTFLGAIISFLSIFVLGLITGIDGYSLSFFGTYIKSNLFKFILSLFLTLTFMSFYYSFIIKDTLDFLKLKKICINLKGLDSAKKKINQSLDDVNDVINNSKDNKIKEEYEKNKRYLLYELQNYELKMSELQKLQTKIIVKLKEKGYSKI